MESIDRDQDVPLTTPATISATISACVCTIYDIHDLRYKYMYMYYFCDGVAPILSVQQNICTCTCIHMQVHYTNV